MVECPREDERADSRGRGTVAITEHTDPRSLGPGTLLTQEEIALLCRVSPQTVKKWRAQGRGPRSVSIGKSSLYEAGDFVAWLDRLADEQTRSRSDEVD